MKKLLIIAVVVLLSSCATVKNSNLSMYFDGQKYTTNMFDEYQGADVHEVDSLNYTIIKHDGYCLDMMWLKRSEDKRLRVLITPTGISLIFHDYIQGRVYEHFLSDYTDHEMVYDMKTNEVIWEEDNPTCHD